MMISAVLTNFAAIWLVGQWFRLESKWPKFWRGLLLAIAAVSLGWLMVSALAYLALPIFYDHGESQVANIAANWRWGGAIYHPVDSAARYSTLYGPVPILLVGAFLSLVPETLIAAKLAGLSCLALTMFGFYSVIKSHASKPMRILVGMGLFATMLLGFDNYSYWIRPDAALLAITVLSLVVVEKIRAAHWLLVCEAILAGLSMNCKIYGAILFVPVLFYWLEVKKPRLKLWHLPLALAGFFAGLAVPFLLPGVSAFAFKDLVSMALHQQLVLHQGTRNFTFALAPLSVLAVYGLHRCRPLSFYSLLASSAVIAVFSAKPGSGLHLFLPLLAIMAFYIFEAYAAGPVFQHKNVALMALALTLSFHARGHQKDEVSYLFQIPQRHRELRDLRALLQGETGMIEMGYGDDSQYEMSFYKTYLVNEGHGLFIDSAGLMEMTFSNLEPPPATYEALASCRIPAFVLPKGDKSWKLENWYYKGSPLFSDRWREIFTQHYSLAKTSECFDLYKCHP